MNSKKESTKINRNHTNKLSSKQKDSFMNINHGSILIKDFEFTKSVVRAHEGYKLKAYNPGDNNAHIGTGFNLERKDAAEVLKACGIPHKISDLKTCMTTITESQAKRLENYLVNEAAFIAASKLGGENFMKLNSAQQAAAISLAFNSHRSMAKIASFIKEDNWDEDYLHHKVLAAEKRDKTKYPGLDNRYSDIQECLKEGSFSKNFYKQHKKIIPPDITPPTLSANDITLTPPASIPATTPLVDINRVNIDIGLSPRFDTSPTLLTAEQLGYFTHLRNRIFAMANSIDVDGSLGDTLKREAMKIGLNAESGNPITGIMGVLRAGITELKNQKSKVNVSDFKHFTEQSYHLLDDLAADTTNIAHCVGLASGTLGFGQKKLDELAQPFLKTAAYYSTTADSILDIYNTLNKKGIGNTDQPVSAFNYGTGRIFSKLPNKVSIAENRLMKAEENFETISELFDNDEAAKIWAQIFNGAATATIDNIALPNLSGKMSEAELNNETRNSALVENNKSLQKTINTMQYGVQFFGTLMHAVGKPDIANAVIAIAGPALSIATIIATWGAITLASGPAAPFVAIAGAILMLGIGIYNLCKGPDGPTRDEIIMRQFERLSIQIDLRFNRLEKIIEMLATHLDARFDELRELFIKSQQIIVNIISQMHYDMNTGFSAILNRVADIQANLNDIARRHNALFTDLYTREFTQLLLFSPQLTIEQLGQGLDPSDAAARRSYLDNYHDFCSLILVNAQSNILAGSPLTSSQSAHELVLALKTAFNSENSFGYESSINTILSYVRIADPKISIKSLANPFIWSRGSLGLIQFIINNPGFLYGHTVLKIEAKKKQQTELQNIIGKGKSIMKFLGACQTSRALWETLISDYKNALHDFLIELYHAQWPSTQTQASTEDATTTLEHVAALKMLDKSIDDYINGRAGPATHENLFHRKHDLPVNLKEQFPNPGHEILPNILVHCLRASEVRFHSAAHMRGVGREILRPYLGIAAADESNGACEEAVKRVHSHLENEVNGKREDQNPGGVLHYEFAERTKRSISEHQQGWDNIMQELRNLPVRLGNERQNAINYGATLLKNTATTLSHATQNKNDPLPNRNLMSKAYATHRNGALQLSHNHHSLRLKLEALDDQAYLLKFFIQWLFPAHPELMVHFTNMLWDKARIVQRLSNSDPFAIVLHNLLEREHPRLPTYLEIFTSQILKQVEAVMWQKDIVDEVELVEPNVVHALKALVQLQALYFEVNIDYKLALVKNDINKIPSDKNYRDDKKNFYSSSQFFKTNASTYSNKLQSKKLRIHSTKGEGDCAFHAALGTFNFKTHRYETTDIRGKRNKVATAIMTCKVDSELFRLTKEAITELVRGSRNLRGETLIKFKVVLQNYEKENKRLLKEKQKIFEEAIKKYPLVVAHIEQFIKNHIKNKKLDKVAENRLQASLFTRFSTCINDGDGTLQNLIMQSDLKKAYDDFKEPNQVTELESPIDWFSENKTALLGEYAEFISKPAQWLLESEVSIIANVFDITINYYPVSTAKATCFNPGKSKQVSVCFNGRNHYERVDELKPNELKQKVSRSP